MSLADKPCGNYVKYVHHKCRCDECRAAMNEVSRKRRKRKAYGGDYWPWVDAERAREHVKWLVSQGIGWQKVAKFAGLSNGHVSALLYGRYERGDKPLQRIHRDTQTKILSVSAGKSKYVEASRTWELISCMKSYGVPKYRISKALGNSGEMPPLQLSKKRITRKHAETVEKLHWNLFRKDGAFRARCKCPRPESVLEEDVA